MHHYLSQILGHEVVGEVTQVGAGFFDVALGRVCLRELALAQVEPLLVRLREVFGASIQVRDVLHLDNARQLIRGFLEVTLRERGTDALYLLQITSKPVVAFYERRFEIAPGVVADLMGTFATGLTAWFQDRAERPLRLLSDYDPLLENYFQRLDAAVHASEAGKPDGSPSAAEQLGEHLRRLWRLAPARLKARVRPVTHVAKDRVCQHDREFHHTVLFANNLEKHKLEYEYRHEPNPLEAYEQVLPWMTEIHQAIKQSYPAPGHATAIARAAAVQEFLDHFPGFRGVAETRPGEESDT
jgi:hypothetical protein